jgi:Holliday junction resolvase
MAEKPEGTVKRKVKAFLKEKGVWFCMPIGGPYVTHGIPDILGCLSGRLIAIECKAPGKKSRATPAQRDQLKAIAAAGGVAVLADCVDDVRDALKEAGL